MGSSSRTKIQKVEKKIGDRGSRSSGSGNFESCLFNFAFKQLIKSAGASILVGDPVALVPDSSANGVDIFINSRLVGKYLGSRTKLLTRCMAMGYIYEGHVAKKISNFEFILEVYGKEK